jgi:hypothetical protein
MHKESKMIHKKLTRVLAALTAVVCMGICFAAYCPDAPSMVIEAEAAGASYKMSDGYKSSPYYENLKKVKLSGEQQRDVVAIALSQLGYHEGNSENELDGLSQSGTRDFVEYNVLYGKIDNGQGNGASYGYYWCASFVNWCLRQAGVPSDASAGAEVSCQRWLADCKSAGIYSGKGGYIPQSGDMVFFRDAGSGVSSTHIGLVVWFDGRQVITVEGNTSSGDYSSDGEYVAIKRYELDSTYIVGYATPKYNESKSYKRVDHTTVSEGQYVASADIEIYENQLDAVNSPKGRIDAYRLFDVVEVGEGERCALVSYEKDGKTVTGYAEIRGFSVQLSTERDTFMINYLDDNGRQIYYPQYRVSGEGKHVYANAPTRDGEGFVGWKLAVDNTEKIYEPGDKLPDYDKDITLYAVWDGNFYLVTFEDEDGSVISQEYGYYGTEFTAPEAPDAPDGYVFVGWEPGKVDKIRGNATYTVAFAPIEETQIQSGTESSATNDGGCSATLSASAVLMATCIGAAAVMLKKKK